MLDEPTVVVRTETAARWTLPLIAMPALVAVVVTPRAADGLDDVKFAVMIALVGWAAWSLWRAADERPPGRQLGISGWAAVAFLSAAALATVTSQAPLQSFIGAHERHNGLVAYLVHATLFLLLARWFPLTRFGRLGRALLAGALAAVVYWALQQVGWDPYGIKPSPGTWTGSDVFASTLSNPNFAGAFVAAALPMALWAVTTAGGSWRRLAAVIGVLALAVAVVASDATQALVAVGAGAFVYGLALALRYRRSWARPMLAAGVVVAVLVAFGAARMGPLDTLGQQETFGYRLAWWRGSVEMAAERPFTGVGLARYSAFTRAHRPASEIRATGWEGYADSAHSVPFDMLAGGGYVLLAAHLAFVGAVGLRLARGLRRLDGERLLLLGAFGGVWAAYQAQALVSIDIAQLAMLHWLSAGVIVALTAGEPVWQRDPTPAPATARARWLVPATGALALVLVVGAWCQSAAELFVGLSDEALDAERPAAALAHARRATLLFPAQPWYRYQLGLSHDAAGQEQQALDAYLAAARQDPRELSFLLAAADAAGQTGRPRLRAVLLRRALEVEPLAPQIKVRVAQAELGLGRQAEAMRLVQDALAFDPAHQEALALRAAIVARGADHG